MSKENYKNEESTKYFTHLEDSIFAGIQIRENPEEAFDNAIKRGMKNPNDWMYMYSENGRDYFKHIDTRNYKSYPQFGVIDTIKNKMQNNKER
ncbi:MAG: hypothetical protein K1W33_04900 [Clostridia bacterium]